MSNVTKEQVIEWLSGQSVIELAALHRALPAILPRSTAFEAWTASTWLRSPRSPGGQEPTTRGSPASMTD